MTEVERIIELLQDTERMDPENEQFLEENYEKIQEEYGGNVVAVVDQEVAGAIGYSKSAAEYGRFLEEIEREYGQDKADRKLLRYVPEPDETMMPSITAQ